MSAYSRFSLGVVTIIAAVCNGCGGGGDSTVQFDGGTNTGTSSSSSGGSDTTPYLALQVKTEGGLLSERSNEISGQISAGDVITWTDPTRDVLGGCISQTEIVGYIAGIRVGSGNYVATHEISKMDDTNLQCTATEETDGPCKSLYRCEYTLQAELVNNV